jgi:putative DNA-binding phage protein|nr:MAG TPA: helix-turn-helix domain protein [Caudoviricetes sp.]
MKDKSSKEVQKKIVGKKIHDIRINLGLTLEKFGELFNASKSDVYRWEKGYHIPNKNRLKQIAMKGGVDVTQLLQGNGQEAIKDIIEIFKSLKREEKEDCLTKLLNLGL